MSSSARANSRRGATGTFEGIEELSRFYGIAAAQRRRIAPNPPAGDVRSREVAHGPWMLEINRHIREENAKAEGVTFEKRVFDLAKQAVACLQGTGVRWEMTSVANILRSGCKFRALPHEKQRAYPDKKREEAEHACRVLDACLRFDSRRLAELLGVSIHRQKTFGTGVPI